ncbi:MAG TPA: substrate-binding domain-containing protein [Cellulomonas sp.]
MDQPLYRRVFDTLRERIRSGEVPVGSHLPAPRALEAEFGVSAITVRRAMDMLRTDGYIVRRPRIGSVVVAREPEAPAERRAGGRPLIGCVLTDLDDAFGSQVLTGVLGEADGRADVVVKKSLGDPAHEEQLLDELTEAGAEGVLLLPTSSRFIAPAVMRRVTQALPMVILDRVFPGVPISSVCSDNVAGAQAATELLFDLGHEHVGLVLPSSTVSSVEDRRAGFVQAHAERRLSLEPGQELRGVASVVPGESRTAAQDTAQLTAYLEARPDLTAFLVSEHRIAVLLLAACRALGRSVPDAVSIVCFDHPPTAFAPDTFRFTHVRQDQDAMGRMAVRQLLAQIEDPTDVATLALPTTLVPGDSTAPPPVPGPAGRRA